MHRLFFLLAILALAPAGGCRVLGVSGAECTPGDQPAVSTPDVAQDEKDTSKETEPAVMSDSTAIERHVPTTPEDTAIPADSSQEISADGA